MAVLVKAAILPLQGGIRLDKPPEVERGVTVIAFDGKLNIFVGAHGSCKRTITLQGPIDGKITIDVSFVLVN
jgi:hypothetical protein